MGCPQARRLDLSAASRSVKTVPYLPGFHPPQDGRAVEVSTLKVQL